MWLGFDIETSGELPEYALQPWRVSSGQGWIRTYALATETGCDGQVVSDHCTHLTQLVRDWVESKHTICAWNAQFEISWLAAYVPHDLLRQVKWLDGMLLWRHLENAPEYTTVAGKRRSFGLKEAVACFLPGNEGYEQGVDFHGEDIEKLLEYNRKDSSYTRIITRHLYQELQKTPERLRAALIESHCLFDMALSAFRGVDVDVEGLERLDKKLAKDVDAARYQMMHDYSVTENVLSSPLQLRKLLFDDWGLEPLKQGKTGPSTDRETLRELEGKHEGVRLINQYRDAKNLHKKFVVNLQVATAYNNDGRAHPIPRVFGTYCVPGDVEVLTHNGWVPIQDWQGGDIVQVEAETLRAKFAYADRHDGGVVDSWVRWQSPKGVCCDFTENHSVPHWEQRGYWRVRTAGELADTGSAFTIPMGCYLDNISTFTPEQTRLLVMAQADGWFFTKSNNGRYGLKFTFKKLRKVLRARAILDALNIHYNDYTCNDQHYLTIGIKSLPSWIGPWCKTLDSWTLDCHLQTFVEELVHWDGSHHRDGGVKFSSSSAQSVEWAATAAALVNKKATIHKPYNNVHYMRISDEIPYRSVHPKNHISRVQDSKLAYCPVTETGFWLARAQGKVFVTGNSGRLTYSSSQGRNKDKRQIGWAVHQMKRDPEFRGLIQAPDGYDIVEFDAAGQEFRWMAIMSNDPTMLALCQPGEDAHAYMGASIAGVDYRDVVAGAKSGDKAMKAARQLGKVANLGLQYRTSAKKLMSVARTQYGLPMTLDEAQRIHRTYQTTYKEVPRYWSRQIRFIEKNLYVATLAGRRVSVTRRMVQQDEWSVQSTSINFPIQGVGADQKYLAMSVLRPVLAWHGAFFALDLHDGLYFFVPKENTSQFIADAGYCLNNLPYEKAWGFIPPIPLPFDCKVGTTWGNMQEI